MRGVKLLRRRRGEDAAACLLEGRERREEKMGLRAERRAARIKCGLGGGRRKRRGRIGRAGGLTCSTERSSRGKEGGMWLNRAADQAISAARPPRK